MVSYLIFIFWVDLSSAAPTRVPTISPSWTFSPSSAPTPFKSLRNVTDETDFTASMIDGVTIEILNDIYLTQTINIDSGDETIIVNGNNHKIDGSNKMVCFYIESFYNSFITFNDLTVTNGYGEGSAFTIVFTTVTVNNCIIINCTSPQGGGGFYVFGDLTLVNSYVINNTALGAQGGGAMYVDSAFLTITGSIFDNNKAMNVETGDDDFYGGSVNNYGGGAIYISGTNPIFSDTSFINNQVSNVGGGIYMDNNVYLTGTNLVFLNNWADDSNTNDFGGTNGILSSTAITCSSLCTSGSYGDCLTAIGASNCFVNCECIQCANGTYLSSQDASSIDSCTPCGVGQISASGSSECMSCPSGTFATNSSSTTDGGQLLQVVAGATHCNDCPIGSKAGSKSSIVCSVCNEGYSSKLGSDSCDLCQSSFYLDPINQICETCPDNTNCQLEHGVLLPLMIDAHWMNISNLQYFKKNNYEIYRCKRKTCPGHSYQFQIHNNNNDDDDDDDKYNDFYIQCWLSENITSCYEKYEKNNGLLLCTEGAFGPLCGACLKNYYFSITLKTCQKCNDDLKWLQIIILCSIIILCCLFYLLIIKNYIYIPKNLNVISNNKIIKILLSIDDGSQKVLFNSYQILQSTSYTLDIIYPPPFQTFLGGVSLIAGVDLSPFECYGVLFYDKIYIISCFPFIFYAFILFSFWIQKCFLLNKSCSTPSLTSSSSTSTSTTDFSHENQFAIRTDSDTSFPFDESNQSQRDDHQAERFSRLMYVNNNTNEDDDDEQKLRLQELYSQHLWWFLLISYLTTPAILLVQLSALDCYHFKLYDSDDDDEGRGGVARYLRLDTRINCDTHQFNTFTIINILFIICYLSIPLVWFVLLYQQKDKLLVKGLTEKDMIKLRANQPSLKPLLFLFDCYRPRYYYWEVLELYRRIFFIGFVPLFSPNDFIRCGIFVFLSLFSLLVYRETIPFTRITTNFLSCEAQLVILIIFLCSFMIASNSYDNLNQSQFGIVLLLLSLSLFIVAFLLAWLKQISKKKEKKKYHLKINHRIENASNFSATKFSTTFDAISEQFISSSQCLVFYYASLSNVQQILLSGIPALVTNGKHNDNNDNDNNNNNNDDVSIGDSGGVLFTLHHPKDLTAYEISLFGSIEACVVCSLPRRLLTKPVLLQPISNQDHHDQDLHHDEEEHRTQNKKQRKIGFQDVKEENEGPDLRITSPNEENAAVLMLDANLLRCLRAMGTVEGLSDYKPWREGALLIPPLNIIRAYQLQDKPSSSLSSPSSSTTTSTSSSSSSASISKQNTQDIEQCQQRTIWNKKHWCLNNSLFQIRKKLILTPNSVHEYISRMNTIREQCHQLGLVPLYHYTSSYLIDSILQNGFRMSTQGQGDGGVYFSTLGPASYDVGSDEYEENIIIDCFGTERLQEFLSQNKLNVCMVYGLQMEVIQQAPGGRSNAKMISKSVFQTLSLLSHDGYYYLRADGICGVFIFDEILKNNQLRIENEQSYHEKQKEEEEKLLDIERRKDLEIKQLINEKESEIFLQDHNIARYIRKINPQRKSRIRSVNFGQNSTDGHNEEIRRNSRIKSRSIWDAIGFHHNDSREESNSRSNSTAVASFVAFRDRALTSLIGGLVSGHDNDDDDEDDHNNPIGLNGAASMTISPLSQDIEMPCTDSGEDHSVRTSNLAFEGTGL